MAGFLGASTIALTSVLLLPFCPVGLTSRTGKLFGDNQPGLGGGSGWGMQEKAAWVLTVTVWGGLGSLLDSALGGWFQASVVDARTGKVIEGNGGTKVSLLQRLESMLTRNMQVLVTDSRVTSEGDSSRRIESGVGFLDNNAVNIVMAFTMSVGGMILASYVWKLPLRSILQ